MSPVGTSRHFVAMRNLIAIGAGMADMTKPHPSSWIYEYAPWPTIRGAGHVNRLASRHNVWHKKPSPISGRAMLGGRRKITEHRQRDLPCPALRKKYSAFAVGQISSTSSPRPTRQEGRIAIVTNAGWDAVDAAASARKVFAGRSSVSGSRRAGRTALVAYGKTVWSRHPLLVSSSRRRSRPNRA